MAYPQYRHFELGRRGRLPRRWAPESEGLALIIFSPTGKYRDGGKSRRSAIPFWPVDEARNGPVLTVMDADRDDARAAQHALT
jgi:hypothetical protein